MAEPINDETTVRALLQMTGMSPTADEVTGMVAGFAGSRAMIQSLYDMPGVRYEEPAVIFDARP